MYSKYLDYSETAIFAHQAAQVENDQKDILIASLKSQLYELRQLQNDFMRLNDYITSLEDKYSLLLNEKDRSQKQQRVKMDINQNTILNLRQQADRLQNQVQKMSLKIEELIRSNTGMKRMSDARAGQIQNLRNQIKSIEGRNASSAHQNQGLALTIKSLKQQRAKLQADCDRLSDALSKNIANLKNLEKQVRNCQSNNARLDKTLHQAEGDNAKLLAQFKQKSQEAKRSEIRLNSLRQNVEELNLTYRNIAQQADKNKLDNATNTNNLQREITKGKQLTADLNEVQASIRAKQSQLDLIISQEQQLRKQHYAGIEKNKALNGQIDRLLALILEYESVNKELLDEIQIYIDQDEQARQILNRRDNMRMLIENTLRKMQATSQPIRHLKY